MSVLVLGATSAAAPCPYAAYRTTICRSYCVQPDAALCIVDGNCKELVSYTRHNVIKDPITSADILVVRGPADYLAELPLLANTIFQYSSANIKLVGDLTNTTLGDAIQLRIVSNRGISFARATFPSSLSALSIENNGLTDLPPSIPYASLSDFDASNNQLTSIANVDFRRAKALAFRGNPALTSFANVRLSPALTSLDFGGAVLTTFLVDESSFRALDSLTMFRVSAIDVSATCRLPNAPRFFKRDTICVIPDPSASDGGGSTSSVPPQFGWMVALAIGDGFVLGVAAWFIYTRRQRRIATPAAVRPSGQAKSRSVRPPTLTSSTPNVLRGSVAPLPIHMDDLALVRLDESKLRKSHVVARGAYGEVWYGEYKRDPVAVKCMLPGKRAASDVQCLVDEITRTVKLTSPYIAHTIGASWATPAALEMVVEWMDRGDLKQGLDQTKPPTDPSTAFP
ncbi:hypothetical protein H310_08316 [Aphanomyces invadans]|uniref:Protein kinase domain-containing protein n=1 Tax=Aphanomyces invadans TaxID=157072 RepID=A0A024TYW3_9STRA|nr:hypothetical protein H310_08316 [Aphanomyces invadans]ETV98811.1 hypothetical protein H310_08316 [Aphanomyces invadans]|eukprot:XP_008872239.1 hypothetical protein H310_08316 [Aphanomyces invadans]